MRFFYKINHKNTPLSVCDFLKLPTIKNTIYQHFTEKKIEIIKP